MSFFMEWTGDPKLWGCVLQLGSNKNTSGGMLCVVLSVVLLENDYHTVWPSSGPHLGIVLFTNPHFPSMLCAVLTWYDKSIPRSFSIRETSDIVYCTVCTYVPVYVSVMCFEKACLEIYSSYLKLKWYNHRLHVITMQQPSLTKEGDGGGVYCCEEQQAQFLSWQKQMVLIVRQASGNGHGHACASGQRDVSVDLHNPSAVHLHSWLWHRRLIDPVAGAVTLSQRSADARWQSTPPVVPPIPPTARPRTKAISDRRDGACPLDHPCQLLTVSPMKSNQPVLEKFIPMRGRGPLSMPESRALWWEMFQNAFTLGTFQGKCAGSECWHNYSWCKWLSARFPCCSIFPREMFLTERKYWLC